jgi:hypothetical protein
MYKNISVRNKNAHLRSIIIVSILGAGVLFGGISLLNWFIGEQTLAENSSGLVPGTDGQVLYAYVKAGEIVSAQLTAIPASEGGPKIPEDPGDVGPNYCTSLAANLQWIYCAPGYPTSAHPDLARVTITGPNNADYSAHFDENFNINDPAMLAFSASSLPSDSTAAAVWRIKIDQDPALDMRFRWEVNVMDGGTKKPGRIWTDEVRISQINSKEHPINDAGGTDLTYYAQRGDGYRYKITQKGYNGFGSTLKIGAFGIGLPDENDCKSAYGSVELPAQNLWPDDVSSFGMPMYIPDSVGKTGKSLDNLPKCSGMASYRLFFDEPDPTLPQDTTVPGWDSSHTFSNLYRAEPAEPDITAAFVTSNNYIGKVVVDSHGTYYGNATLELDADGNNSDDYVPITSFAITENGAEIAMDGTRNNKGGEKIPLNTLVKGRIVLDYLGEVHIISLDIEERGGGIEVERQNGSAAKRYQLFWNDNTQWLSQDRLTKTTIFDAKLPDGVNSQGGVHGWMMPDTYATCSNSFSIWAITEQMKNIFLNNQIWCPFDKIGHFNQYAMQAWGDNRAIEDWTFDIDRTALLQQKVREDSYFDYIFRDNTPPNICNMTDAEFINYYAGLASDSEKTAAQATRLACTSTPPTPCPYDPSMLASDKEHCVPPEDDPCKLSSVEAIMSHYSLNRDAAQKVYNNCHPVGNPNTGLKQKDETQNTWQVVK